MAQVVYRYEFPDRFVAGAIGDPGRRTFFVQARLGSRLTSVRCEKQQVQVLADHLERVLDELQRLSEGALDIPDAREGVTDRDPLDAPLHEDFRAGTMTIAWDSLLSAVQVELFSETDAEPADVMFADERTEGEALEVKVSPAQARDFVARARELIAAGRPACPFCGQPIDPEGHICPRSNGYRTPLFD